MVGKKERKQDNVLAVLTRQGKKKTTYFHIIRFSRYLYPPNSEHISWLHQSDRFNFFLRSLLFLPPQILPHTSLILLFLSPAKFCSPATFLFLLPHTSLNNSLRLATKARRSCKAFRSDSTAITRFLNVVARSLLDGVQGITEANSDSAKSSTNKIRSRRLNGNFS